MHLLMSSPTRAWVVLDIYIDSRVTLLSMVFDATLIEHRYILWIESLIHWYALPEASPMALLEALLDYCTDSGNIIHCTYRYKLARKLVRQLWARLWGN